MTVAALMYLIALVLFLLVAFGVTLGTVGLVPLGLAFVALGLLISASTFNRNVG